MFNVSVYFNNFDLSTLEGIKVINYNISEMPTRILNAPKLARANKSLLTSAEYANKTVSVTVMIGGEDWTEQQENLDRLKSKIQDADGVLRVQQGDLSVEYIGTLNGISKDFTGITLGVTLSFFCANPIGRDAIGSELFASTNIVTSTLTKSLTVEGSAEASPRFHLVFTDVVGGISKSVTLLNAATGKGIRITRDWVDGDILDINSDTMEVIVNSENLDFEGQFPTFLPGGRTLQYIDDFTTRDVTMTAIYTRQYS